MCMNKENETQDNRVIGGINFLVFIQRMDSFSIQGVIEWLDTGKKAHFRSGLELLSLMESAFSEASGSNRMRSWNENKQIKVI